LLFASTVVSQTGEGMKNGIVNRITHCM